MVFKRKRVHAPRRMFGKRRRFTRKRTSRFRRTGRTSQASTASAAMSLFRRKPFSARRFANNLFAETRFKSHYRSFSSSAFSRISGLSTTDSNVFQAFPMSIAFPFWLATGGAQQLNAGTAVPTFNGDIVLRGGKFNMTVANMDPPLETVLSGDPMKLRVWFLYTVGNPDFTSIPTTANNGWDPSTIPEFRDKVGKIYHFEEVLLRQGDVYQFSRKLRPSKIDQNRWLAGANVPMIIIQGINMSTSTGVIYDQKFDFNCAFSGDT